MTSTPDSPQRLRRPALWLAALVLAYSGAVAAASQNEEQLRALRTRIEALQADLNETRGERDEARAQLRESERRIGSQFKSLRDTEARQRSETARLTALQQARTRSRAELGTHRQELEQAVRAAYVLGKQDYLKLLLSQDDPARVSRTLTYYRYLTQAHAARIEGIETALSRLDVLEKQIAERVQELAALRTRQLEQKNALEATRAERRNLLAQLNERVRDRSQEVERLKHDEDRMTRLVRELRTALTRAPAPEPPVGKASVDKGGRWRLPVQGRLIARFGSPKEIGDLRWRGIFLAASEGQEVKAVTRGRVAYADWLRGFGLLVVLDHGGGLMSLYGHNQSLYKGVGDRVEAGEAIAASGNTGGPPQPGLYFEIREHGEPRNPLDWCRL
ncbi:MAG TPA: peptidoglycan DD-metalloendopeptidase family protein [Acidiferrobacterales bacterium]|nr:peptidoglycan DD-metalloendopeptidase family protein [Acidiferrobacterales bacterium]